MATFEMSGLAEVKLTFDELQKIPVEVQDEMLDVQAKIVEPEISRQAVSMGVYDTGAVSTSVYHKSPSTSKNGNRQLFISFKGSRRRGKKSESNAAIAFYNEFGVKREGERKSQPARPFIRTAVEIASTKAMDAAADVLNKFIEKIL